MAACPCRSARPVCVHAATKRGDAECYLLQTLESDGGPIKTIHACCNRRPSLSPGHVAGNSLVLLAGFVFLGSQAEVGEGSCFPAFASRSPGASKDKGEVCLLTSPQSERGFQ